MEPCARAARAFGRYKLPVLLLDELGLNWSYVVVLPHLFILTKDADCFYPNEAKLERRIGIEPMPKVWKTFTLPLRQHRSENWWTMRESNPQHLGASEVVSRLPNGPLVLHRGLEPRFHRNQRRVLRWTSRVLVAGAGFEPAMCFRIPAYETGDIGL
jgi:hypothetical protein